LSIPRIVVSSFINLFAVTRAWKIFITHLITGKKIAWDKTQHFYPNVDALKQQRKHIGELLLDWQQISQAQLTHAVLEQQLTGKEVGRLLLEQGVITQEKYADALAEQIGLPRATIVSVAIKQFFGRLPRKLSQQYRVVPFAEAADGTLELASDAELGLSVIAEIRAQLGCPVAFFVATEQEISAALAWYGIGDDTVKIRVDKVLRKPLGDFLIESGVLSSEKLAQHLATYNAARDGGIGAFLLAQNVVTPAQLNQAIRLQAAQLGEQTSSQLTPWSAP
jgi:bacteriophage N4 adsorption protein B